MPKPGPVAVIGAGLAGLSCAQALQAAGAEVCVFEKENRTGGRCATRLWQGHLVDYGVQYLTAQSSEFKRELLTRLRQFRPLVAPILDPGGKVIHTDGGPRFYVLQGNNYFAHVLSRDLSIHLDTPVERIEFRDGAAVIGEQTFRAVVSALPDPQTAEVFGLGEPAIEYSGCLCVVLEYNGLNVGDSENCYGRTLPSDGSSPLAASFCENHKSGRVLGEKTVFVLEATSAFSRTHAARAGDDCVPELARAHEDAWKIPSGRYTASFVHHWSYAFPRANDRKKLELPPGAFACGDARTESKVEPVWLDGRRAADEVMTYLKR